MGTRDISGVQAAIQSSFQAGDYQAAYDLATAQLVLYPQHTPLLEYWRICMAASMGEEDLALDILEQTLEKGIWYAETLLRKSPALENFQGHARFEALVRISQTLQAQAQSERFPLLTLRPEGCCHSVETRCPCLLGLHASNATAESSLEFWKPASQAGWLVAAPQSSQAIWKDAYIWDDYTAARQEIGAHLAALDARYAIDPEQVVIAGDGMGGEVAIRIALEGYLPLTGVLVVAPTGPLMDNQSSWRSWLSQAAVINASEGPKLRGVFVIGENDAAARVKHLEAFADMLIDHGIPVNIEVVLAAGDDYTPGYHAAILRSLDFLTEV